MTSLVPPQFRPLCRLQDIPDGGALGLPRSAAGPGAGAHLPGLIVVRLGEAVRVYQNACPHIGTPLDWVQGRFFSADGQYLICATHGAAFALETGLCVAGPCRGDVLPSVPSAVQDGTVMVAWPP